MEKVSQNGVITVEESKTAETYSEVVEGMQFDRGYIDVYKRQAYNRKGMTAFAVFCLSLFVGIKDKPLSDVGCRSPPYQSGFFKFQIDRRNRQWVKSIQIAKKTSTIHTP